MSEQTERRVVMAKRLAARWIIRKAKAEYRFSVLLGSREIKNLPNLLRSMRDAKLAMEGVPTIPDLGIEESFDKVTMWSNDRDAMVKLADWFERRGFDTTGVW
jgi:hypothetical protein